MSAAAAAADAMAEPAAEKKRQTYAAGCHCGYIRFDVTLSPPLDEYEVLECGCSICRRAGYLLVYPERADVQWHGKSRERCAVYRFNTKEKDQLFCPKCGASLGIDFRDFFKPKFDGYGISARTFDNIDLRALKYTQGDGVNNVPPAGDLSGQWYESEDEGEGHDAGKVSESK